MESKLRNRAIEASTLILKRKGYEILDRELGASYIGLVAIDEGTLVFLHVAGANSIGGFPDETLDREAAETGAVSWLASHDAEVSDMPVRFDEIAFSFMGETRALARHRINVLGESAS